MAIHIRRVGRTGLRSLLRPVTEINEQHRLALPEIFSAAAREHHRNNDIPQPAER